MTDKWAYRAHFSAPSFERRNTNNNVSSHIQIEWTEPPLNLSVLPCCSAAAAEQQEQLIVLVSFSPNQLVSWVEELVNFEPSDWKYNKFDNQAKC